ncbi:MAG: integrase family protein [Methylocystaceae bacterium]|nr:integrase family protein [Methylocystaceae bacterium]
MKITKSFLNKIAPTDKDQFYFDEEIKGFLVKITPAGRISFGVQAGKARKRKMIGTYPTLTPDQAREIARNMLANYQVTGLLNTVVEVHEAELTMFEVVKEYIADRYRTPDSKQSATNLLNARVKDKLGDLSPREIDEDFMSEWKDELVGLQPTYNRIHTIINAAWKWAQKRKKVAKDLPNPLMDIKKYKARVRKHVMTGLHYQKFGEEIRKMLAEGRGNSYELYAIMLTMLTGFRNREVCYLRKDMVDRIAHTITFPVVLEVPDRHGNMITRQGHKTAKDVAEKVVNVSKDVIELLDTVIQLQESEGRDGAEFFFLSNSNSTLRCFPHKPLHRIHHTWVELRRRAGIENRCIHSFRAGFASQANHVGVSVVDTAAMLGHADTKTTLSHYMNSSEKDVDRMGAHMKEMIGYIVSENRSLPSGLSQANFGENLQKRINLV